MLSKEGFQRIYLLSGTAPEFYGTGHAMRAPTLISWLQNRSSLPVVRIQIPIAAEGFYQSPFARKTLESIRAEPGLIVIDARDLKPEGFSSIAPTLLLDNRNAMRPSRPGGQSRTVDFSQRFPIFYYDTLMHPQTLLRLCSERYLGMPPSIAGARDSQLEKDVPGVLFYAGPPGFLDAAELANIDGLFAAISGISYRRIGGTVSSNNSDQRSEVSGAGPGRLDLVEFRQELQKNRFYLGYPGVSMIEAALLGCRVWGLRTGHAYHDWILDWWAAQTGAPILDLKSDNSSEIAHWAQSGAGWKANRWDGFRRFQSLLTSILRVSRAHR